LRIRHPEPSGSRWATPPFLIQQRPGQSLPIRDPDLANAVRKAKGNKENGVKHDSDGNTPPKQPTWKSGSFTAKELQSVQFPPVSWIVPNIIPAEGVTLLCSKPKFGKSWLTYDLCIASTMDRFTLGTIKSAQGDVLYLALEDSKRRLQRRMIKLLPTFGAPWPEKLTLKTEWRRLHEGGLDDIRAWHAHTKNTGGNPILVVIDVLAKVRKPVGNRQLYESDYAALADLTKLANELELAIVVVHHTRKMAADDLMETVSGSYGVSGAVDTILVLATKASGAVLDIRGRDVESGELAIEFNKATCRWRVLGDAAEVHVSEQRAKIIAVLKEAGEPMGITALIEATGTKRNALELSLGRMAKEGLIRRVAKGLYAHKDYEPPPNDPLGTGKPGKHRSVASVGIVDAQTDRATDKTLAQHAENVGKNNCLSVGSVCAVTGAEITPDKMAAESRSVLTRTDRTDRQIDPQVTQRTGEFRASDLSDSLSHREGQTDAISNDFPELPEFLRRAPPLGRPASTSATSTRGGTDDLIRFAKA
jgi:hypothetical protein